MTGVQTCALPIWYDFVNNDADPLDDFGHGSHVAGIVASEDSTYKGVAPDAKIVAIKVLSASGSGSTSDVISGVEWCTSNAATYNISVITMSLGNSWRFSNYCDYASPESRSIDAAVGQGIFVSVASGNDYYGYAGSRPGISGPACVKNATSVGATDDSDSITSFTNRDVHLDLLAPGSGIIATDYSGGHISKSGTSMATPHVAGAAALLQQYSKEKYNKTLTPKEIEKRLKSTGKPINDTGGTGWVFPRIDVLSAIESKGAVSTIVGDKPFYTISSNPMTTGCLSHLEDGETCNQTWTVNATGGVGGTWEF